MLCSMCKFGVNRKELWKCPHCGEESCRHFIWECPKCKAQIGCRKFNYEKGAPK